MYPLVSSILLYFSVMKEQICPKSPQCPLHSHIGGFYFVSFVVCSFIHSTMCVQTFKPLPPFKDDLDFTYFSEASMSILAQYLYLCLSFLQAHSALSCVDVIIGLDSFL